MTKRQLAAAIRKALDDSPKPREQSEWTAGESQPITPAEAILGLRTGAYIAVTRPMLEAICRELLR